MYKLSVKDADNYTSSATKWGLRRVQNALSRDRLGQTLVFKGYISPYDLKSALHKQKKTRQPLGKIFIERGHITKYQLIQLLFRQKVVRFTAASLLCFVSLMGTKKSHAGTLKDVPARIALLSPEDRSFQNINHYPDLFGAQERRSGNLSAFTKWSDMFKRFDANVDDKGSRHIIQALQFELRKYKSSSLLEMAKHVNTFMNRKKYIVDSKNWGKSDYWATPIEFMARGGDCEDFAIAKYTALRALGVPESRMRIAIVQDQKKDVPHAILIVYAEDGAWVLDNQIKNIRRADSIAHYKPIFSINREAWWIHTIEEKPTTIVAAAR